MSAERIEWLGGPSGSLHVDGLPENISNLVGLMKYCRVHCGSLSNDQLRFLGALTLFLSIRDHAKEARHPVLNTADRALDSLDPVLPERSKDLFFQEGIVGLQESLFKHRSEPYHAIVDAAFAHLAKEGKRFVSGATA